MSKKPAKKSDLNKGWMRPRISAETRIIAPEFHLIVTEGTKTEPNYFEGLKQDINSRFPGRISIQIEGIGQGKNTLTLLECAQKLVSPIGKYPDVKHVWLVYDKDDFPKDDFDNTYFRCIALSNDSPITYHALWSNECIEYWFLLHYIQLVAALPRDEYYPMLSDHLRTKYEKNSNDIYNQLKPNLYTAIKNAKSIMADYGERSPSQCTPGTNVYEIFEKLQSYLK